MNKTLSLTYFLYNNLELRTTIVRTCVSAILKLGLLIQQKMQYSILFNFYVVHPHCAYNHKQ
jgi:hypothetical protein